MEATRITESICYHAEGPIWSDSWGGLRWVDMLAGDIMHLDADGQVHRISVPSPVVACVRPRAGGGAVLGVEKGFALESPDGEFTVLEDLWEGEIRMNEGAAAPDGSFYCGSMAYDQSEDAASMWRLSPQLEVTRVADRLTVSNGLAFSPDRTLAYYVDTPTGRVDVLDVDPTAGLHNRRTFADLSDQDGHPDGLTVDAEGHVWVAMNNGGQVLGLDDLGIPAQRITVGARQVTACTFGGEDLATLYITTSRENLPEDEDPAAGSLFAATPGARGQAEELVFTG
ncbi:MAG: SMP-30/gluconolactonase/LRE family protein [Brachybacterium sp.]|nr:SMP-30/gluconolactonase/LRE family protein [Brachybacterium sp.]